MPWISNSPGNKTSATSQTINMLITRPINPKVNILKGKVIIFKIGLMKKFIKPKITPAKTKVCQEPVNSTPGTNLIDSHNPRIPAIIWKISLNIEFFIKNEDKEEMNISSPFFYLTKILI